MSADLVIIVNECEWWSAIPGSHLGLCGGLFGNGGIEGSQSWRQHDPRASNVSGCKDFYVLSASIATKSRESNSRAPS